MSFISELKRRRVFRVAAIYILSAWLILQVADVLFPGWGIAENAIRFVVYAATAGFPLALVFAWMFDITPQGVRRTPSIDALNETSLGAKDYGLLVLLVGLFVGIGWNFANRVAETRLEVPEATAPLRESEARLLAILPFKNESLDAEDAAFLANGVHRDLMTNVMKIASLAIIAPSSVEQYRGTDKRSRAIGRELAVSHILEGAVQMAGSRVRITLQLVEADTEVSLWAESYDRILTTDNLFEIQADIATQVSIALQAEMTDTEQLRVQAAPTNIFEAYEALARGYQAYDENSAADMKEALFWFNQALEIEPGFAQAHQAKGRLYQYASQFGALPRNEALQLAEASLRRAIELDPDIGPAYAWLGSIYRDRDGDFEKALEMLDISLAKEPGNARAMHIKGLTLRMLGQFKEALPWYERAQQLDPLSLTVTESFGSLYRDMGLFEESELQYQRAFEMDGEFPSAWWGMGTLYWTMGKPAIALEWFEGAVERSPFSDDFFAWLSLVNLELGRAKEAEESARASMATLGLLDSSSLEYVLYLAELALESQLSQKPEKRSYLGHIWFGSAMQLPIKALMQSRFADVLSEIEINLPNLENADHTLDFRNYRAAVDAAVAMYHLGEEARYLKLLDRAEAFIETQNRMGFRGYWVEDARIAALRGDTEGALTILETAVAEGWRNLWWFYFRHDPALESIRNQARFQALHSMVELEMTGEQPAP